jgi:dimethylhistidine N-methyltransferase
MMMIARELVSLPLIAQDVEQGLHSKPKSLPAKLFYDAAGSALFEEITDLPEYYLTRSELEILESSSEQIIDAAGTGLTIVELGAGTARKTTTLLQALEHRQLSVSYVPVDISRSALDEAKIKVKQSCPRTLIRPVVADFADGFDFLHTIPGRKLVLYLGSSIGNFDTPAAAEFLLGTDLAKDPSILIPAYDDAQGVTAKFNKNVLRRINRELGADFDLASFRHVALWNTNCSRIEMHLESTRAQTVRLGVLGSTANFRQGERIHTENSYKYTPLTVESMLSHSGLTAVSSWLDSRGWFALTLAKVG